MLNLNLPLAKWMPWLSTSLVKTCHELAFRKQVHLPNIPSTSLTKPYPAPPAPPSQLPPAPSPHPTAQAHWTAPLARPQAQPTAKPFNTAQSSPLRAIGTSACESTEKASRSVSGDQIIQATKRHCGSQNPAVRGKELSAIL
jgi:hypothetical protein